MVRKKESQIHDVIKHLATNNDRFHGLISFPITLLLITTVIDLLVSISITILYTVKISNLFFICNFFMQILAISWYGENIRQSIKRIVNHIVTMRCKSNQRLFRVIQNQNYLDHSPLYVSEHYLIEKNQRKKSYMNTEIRIQEIFDIYDQYFTFRIFHLCKVNFRFLLDVTLIILNYVVLLTQTQ